MLRKNNFLNIISNYGSFCRNRPINKEDTVPRLKPISLCDGVTD